MNKTSLPMLLVGIILGFVIGYVTLSTKRSPPEFNIQAQGFRNVGYANEKFNVDIVKRVDSGKLEIIQNIQFPAEGFLKGFSALKQLVEKLENDGVLVPVTDAAGDEPTEE